MVEEGTPRTERTATSGTGNTFALGVRDKMLLQIGLAIERAATIGPFTLGKLVLLQVLLGHDRNGHILQCMIINVIEKRERIVELALAPRPTTEQNRRNTAKFVTSFRLKVTSRRWV